MRKRFKKSQILLLLCMMWLSVTQVMAQSMQITGKITDLTTGEVLPGVNVIIKGTTQGSTSDMSGVYKITANKGDVLVFTYVGFNSEERVVESATTLDIALIATIEKLSEVVVIGYGTQKKGDLTGSLSYVTTKDFNKGVVNSPVQLINGKVSGLQIMSGSGSPNATNTIRIRGGASLNASNEPLIVLDGIPLETGGISGNSNFLSLINPNDIESITILKDASSTAIYGSRASNGVIIITTKKAKDNKINVNFSTNNSIQVKTKLADMLSTDEFRNVVNTLGTDAQKNLLKSQNTNWNDQVYQIAFGTDNNLSVSGIYKKIPARLSLGYYNQNGIVKTDNSERITGNLSVTPSLLKDDLKFTLGLKATLNKNTFANTSAIWGGATFNPTLPVYSGSDRFGGYTEAIDNTGKPVTSAVLNPLGALEQYESTSDVNRVISSLDVDYKFRAIKDLKYHASLAYDYAEGKGKIFVNDSAMQYYVTGGRNYSYGPQKLINKLISTYLNYNKNIGNSTLDLTAGYDYQYWESTRSTYAENNIEGVAQSTVAAFDQRHVLISYYGRLNYTLASKYMLTATVRSDGTSRFSKDNRWGTFPSFALGWRLSEENFIKNLNIFSNLKLRASYGVTGQQDGIGNYNYLAKYTLSQPGAEYIMGADTVKTSRPEEYISDLKWETTKSYNYGIDFGFFNNKLNGSFEYYTRKTEDLLASVPSPAGTNFEKYILTNVGNVDSKGWELTLNATAINTKEIGWELSFNASWMDQKIKNLSIIKGSSIVNTLAGPTIDSYQFQVLSEGYAPYMFYVYHQVYDENNRPVEGLYANTDSDPALTTNDLYRYHSPAPKFILGFSTQVRYDKFTLGTSLRAHIGNYVYNGMSMNSGALGTMAYNAYQLNNLNKSFLKTQFRSRQYLSDYYVENASFLKMDNVTLSYDFGKLFELFNLSATAMVQNVFTITKYTGVDPEVPNGMDNTFYPRPRIYSISLGIDF